MEANWVSERVRDLAPSATIDLGDRIKRLRASGRDVLDLISGAPELDTPPGIKREARAALEEDYRYMTYSLSAGLEDLRRAIADKLRGENGIAAHPERIIVTVGVKEGVALAAWACLDPGDEVLLLTPGWVTYDALIRLAGAAPVSVPLRKGAGRMLTGADLAARITPRTRAILLNTPHNPTGRVFGPEELEAIADTARRHDLLVLADETLEYLVYTDAVHRSIAALPAMAERTLTFNGFSKAYSMAGWRVGYVHGPAPLVANMLKVHQHLVTCANVVAQKAATAALGGPRGGRAGRRAEIRADIRAVLADRRGLVARALDSVPGIRCPAPEAGLFCFPDVAGTGMDDREFAGFCLEEAQVAVLPGSAFGAGGEGHVRVAFGRRSTEALAAGVERIREALSRRDRAGAGSRAAAGTGSGAGIEAEAGAGLRAAP